MKTFEEVRKLVAKQLNISEDKVTLETNIVKDLGADSIDLVEMLMVLEDNYNLTIPDGDTEKMQTVAAIVELIDAKKK